ncbi:MAG: type II toxin-antitoxin system Phd/YefM family antitoxin [Cyanobium usitatum Tobar12.5m-G36]|nr:type II toxin-antitoxin system Phd/YefM family antitoxin [Cyanobium usitatum Tobar12.5m-G36]
MDEISNSTTRTHLAGTINKVCDNHEPVVITRRGEEETTYLLRSPANAQRLLRSIACLNSGE